MEDENKSRAEYYRRRRKTGAGRLEEASRDAERKRKGRGGYKTENRQYEEMIAALPPDQQIIARCFYEYPHDGNSSPSEFYPLPSLDDSFAIITVPSPVGGEDPKPWKEPKRLSLTANAKMRRREEFRAHHDREIVKSLKSLVELEIKAICREVFPRHRPGRRFFAD